MGSSACPECGHEGPPGAPECPGCGHVHLASGRRVLVGRRSPRRPRRRGTVLLLLALAIIGGWLLYLEWSELPEPEATGVVPVTGTEAPDGLR